MAAAFPRWPQLIGSRRSRLCNSSRFGRLVARLLTQRGRPVGLIDLSPLHCREARGEGLTVFTGDSLSPDTLDEAGTRYADTVLAMTRNQELNLLVAQLVRDNFRVERVLALADSGTLRPYASPFPGQFPGTDEVNRRLRLDQLHVVDVDAADWVGRPLADAPFAEVEFAVLLEHRDQVYVAGSDHVLSAGDRIVCLRPEAVGDAGSRSAPRYSA